MYPGTPQSSQATHTSYTNRSVTNAQLPPAEYHKSQRQCLEQLQQYKALLMHHEQNITLTMENFYKDLRQVAYRQHQKVKHELMRMLDESFEKNWKYLSQSIIFQGEPSSLVVSRQKIASVSARIAQLQMGLRTQNYKPYIAEVVTSNFDGVIEQINHVILSTKQSLCENIPSILIDREKMKILAEGVNSILIFNPNQTPLSQISMCTSSVYPLGKSPRGKSPVSPRTSQTMHSKKTTTQTLNFM